MSSAFSKFVIGAQNRLVVFVQIVYLMQAGGCGIMFIEMDIEEYIKEVY